MAEINKWKLGQPLILSYQGYSLRSLSRKDIDERFVSMMNDEEVNRHVAVPKRVTREQIAAYVDTFDNNSKYFLGIFPENAGMCIGYYRLGIDSNLIASGAVMIFDKGYWRRGVLSDCAYMVRKFVFAVLNVHKLEYRIYADNHAMVEYFKRSSYAHEGTLRESESDGDSGRRDVLVFGLLRSEWSDDPPAR